MIQGLVFGNLKKDRSDVVVHEKDSLPETRLGGLSGAPTRQQSTELLRQTYRHYGDRFTLFGVGGVLSAEDAYEKIKAGASFVQLVTGLIMNGPQFVEEVNSGLVRLMKEDGFSHISEAVGANEPRQ
jgi:dihydroorotate dehydrogenase (fumarate)